MSNSSKRHTKERLEQLSSHELRRMLHKWLKNPLSTQTKNVKNKVKVAKSIIDSRRKAEATLMGTAYTPFKFTIQYL